jgi:hypothetical protein
MKKILLSFLIVSTLLIGGSKFVLADGASVNLTVKNNGDIVYSGIIPLSSTPSEDNVLSVIKQADTLSPDFNISNIVHYSFGDYFKCITISETTELCDNWLYKVNGDSPMMGMDSYPLSGNENIVLYFGDENKAPTPEVVPEPEPENPPAHSEGGGGYVILNTVCEQGEKFNVTTGQLCTSFIPSPLLVSPTPIPPSLNINLDEKSLEHSLTGESKEIFPTNPKKQIKKISKITLGHSPLGSSLTDDAMGEPNQNTTTIINSVPPVSVQNETPKKTWWGRFWDKIFSIF